MESEIEDITDIFCSINKITFQAKLKIISNNMKYIVVRYEINIVIEAFLCH